MLRLDLGLDDGNDLVCLFGAYLGGRHTRQNGACRGFAIGGCLDRGKVERHEAALGRDPALEGDRVEPALVCSIRSLRRIGPNKEINFELVAEIVQRRWIACPDGKRSEFYGGSTVIIGPDGQIRYLISKDITNAQRVAAQSWHLDSAEPSKAWEERHGRLFVPQMSLRDLHECNLEKTGERSRRTPCLPAVAAINPVGRRGSGQNRLQKEKLR
jgi:hypothetical protein